MTRLSLEKWGDRHVHTELATARSKLLFSSDICRENTVISRKPWRGCDPRPQVWQEVWDELWNAASMCGARRSARGVTVGDATRPCQNRGITKSSIAPAQHVRQELAKFSARSAHAAESRHRRCPSPASFHAPKATPARTPRPRRASHVAVSMPYFQGLCGGSPRPWLGFTVFPDAV
jgi:hypothetical protein